MIYLCQSKPYSYKNKLKLVTDNLQDTRASTSSLVPYTTLAFMASLIYFVSIAGFWDPK